MLEPWIPKPLREEIDVIEVKASPHQAYQLCRHLDLAHTPLVHALFKLRTLPERLHGQTAEPLRLKIDDMVRPEKPGFCLLEDQADIGFVVGAIAQVWEPEIPFYAVTSDNFKDFNQPGWARVAWSLTFKPFEFGTQIQISLRFDTTNSAAMLKLERYFQLIGPFSHFIRRYLLAQIGRELGLPDYDENKLPLPGDECLPKALVQATHSITIKARPEQIWPWLVQMGCRRGGWYSYDQLDNGGQASADKILPGFQALHLGDVLPATPEGEDGFTVIALQQTKLLVLGCCLDVEAQQMLSYDADLPSSYLRTSWAFVLLPLEDNQTRLTVRVRADYAPQHFGFRALWMLPLHHFMETRQLQNLKHRIEHNLQL